MNLKMIGKNISITKAMEEVLTEKLSKLDKFFDTDVEARVAVSATRTTQKIEVTIPLGSGIIRSEVQDEDLYNAADLAVEKLARQLRKYKEKLIRKGHDTIRYENIETPSSDTETMEIVKRKRFVYKPMSEEEAMLQMNLLGHDFFVFRRAEDDMFCLLYISKDGNYGIIEQE